MTICLLSSEQFSAGGFSFFRPALRQQIADRLRGNNEARLESLVLIDRDEETPERCRGGMVVPLSPGKILTAAWPVAETREVEDRLLEGYASAVAGMSFHRTATVLSELDVVSEPPGNRGPFVPLTQILRLRLSDLTAFSVPDSARQLRWQGLPSDSHAALELLQSTEEGSLDTPEFLQYSNWCERLDEYQRTSPQSSLFIARFSDRESPVGAVVWSVDATTEESEIHYLGVLPSVRRRGWGGRILQRVCSQSRERGADSIALNVDVRNHVAIRLYESAGFRESFRRRFWIPHNENSFSTGSTHKSFDLSDF